jgi:hypothetical protein
MCDCRSPATDVLMATLEILTSRPRFTLQYALARPTITINGTLTEARWGVNRFELAPGDYDVAVAVPSVFRSQRGKNIVFIRLLEGDTKRAHYTAPLYSLMPGTITVDPTLPPARVV